MPFIRGRYHINPVAGAALEAALAAEAQDSRDGDSDERDAAPGAYEPGKARGPIHHVEIESAQLVPSHSGHAARGFVVRVHRHSPAGDGDGAQSYGRVAAKGASDGTETHAFTDHRDLVNYLRDEFAKDCAPKGPR